MGRGGTPGCRHEQGEFYSLDLGGSNLRVMYVKLSQLHGQVVRPGLKDREITYCA